MTKKISNMFVKFAAVFVVVIVFLLVAKPANATIGSGDDLGSTNSKASNQASLELTTSATAEQNNMIVVAVATDNCQTTDGESDAITSVEDFSSNVYTYAYSYTNGEGSARTGASVSVFFTKVGTQLTGGDTITANFDGGCQSDMDATAIHAWEYTVGAGATFSVSTQDGLADDGPHPGSLQFSSLNSQEWLFFRGIGYESDADMTGLTVSSGYASIGVESTDGAGEVSNMGVTGEYDIVTATSTTSNPAYQGDTSNESASVLVAFEEISTITVSGTIYQPDESSDYGCNSGGPYTVRLRVDGGGTYSGDCTLITGAWEVTGVTANSGQTIYAYIYNETPKGSTVLVSDGTTKTDVPIYQNRVTLRDDVNGSITDSEILAGNTADADDLITTSGTDVSVSSSYETHIYTSDTFAPGDDVTTGKLHVVGNYSGTAETLTLTGTGTGTSRPLYVNGGSFTTPDVTTFTGDGDTGIEGTTYDVLNFTPTITAGRAYTFTAGATINGNFTANPDASSSLTLTVNLGGTTTVGTAYTTSLTGTTSGESTLDTTSGSSHSFSTGLLNIAALGGLTANNSTITLTGETGTLFTYATGDGSGFTAGGSTVVMNPDSAITLFSANPTLYNLSLTPSLTSGESYSVGSALTINGDFTINPDASGLLLTVEMGGDITVASGKTTTITRTSTATSALDMRPGGVDYDLSTGFLNIATGGTLDAGGSAAIVTLTGTSGTLFTLGGTFTAGSSIVTFTPDADVTLFSGSPTLYDISIAPSITVSRVYIFGGALSVNGDMEINPDASSSLSLTAEMGGDITAAATSTITLTGTNSGTSILDLRPDTTDYDISTGFINVAAAGTLDATDTTTTTITLDGTSSTLFTRVGTFNAGSSTVTVSNASGTPTLNSGTITFYNLISDTGANFDIAADISVAKNLTNTTTGIIGYTGTPTVTMTSGSATLGGGNADTITLYNLTSDTSASVYIESSLSVAGDITNTGAIAYSETPTLTMTGTSKSLGGGAGAISLYSLTSETGASISIDSSITLAQDLENLGSITYSGTPTLTMTGIASAIDGGASPVTLYKLISESGAEISFGVDVTIANDLTNTGAIASTGSTIITFNGTGTRIIGGGNGDMSFYALSTSGTGTFNFSGGGTNTFANNVTAGTGTTLNINSTVSIAGDLVNTTDGAIGYSGTPTITMTGASGNIGGGSGSIGFHNLTIDGTTITANSDLTVNSTLIIASNDELSIAASQIVTHSGSTLTLTDSNSKITGSGTFYYTSSTPFPSTGTFSAGLRIDTTNNDQALPERTYGGAVEIYNNSGASPRNVVLGTAGSQTLTFSGNLILNAANTQSVTLTGATNDPTINITGNLDSTNGGGAEHLTTGGGIWTVGGNIDFTDVGTLTLESTNTFDMTGDTKIIISATETLQNFKVSGTGSASSIDAMDVNGTFTLSGTATFTHGDFVNLNIAGNISFAAGITFNKSTGGTVIFDGDMTYDDNTGSINPPTPPDGSLQDLGDVEIGASPATTNLISDFSANSLTVVATDYFNTCEYEVDIGNGNLVINGTMDTSDTGQGDSPCSGGDEGDETWIYDASYFTVGGTGSFAQDQSTLVTDNPSATDQIDLSGESLYNLTVSPSGTTQFANGAIDIDNNLTITTGTLDMNGQSVTLGGNFDNDANLTHGSNSFTFDASSGTKTIDADGDTDPFYDVTFSDGGSGPTYQLTTLLDVNNDLTISGGTLDANGQAMSVQGSWDNSGGTFTSNSNTVTFDDTDGGETLAGTMTGSSSFYTVVFNDGASSGAWSFGANSATLTDNFTITGGTVTAPGSGYSLTIGGNFTNDDGFTHNSGTVVFNDSGQESKLLYTANTTFYGMTISTATKQMKFDQSERTIVSNNLTIQGTDCDNLVYLDSDVTDNDWEIDVTGAGTVDIDYADIEDSTAITTEISAENSTEVNEGNTNWDITSGSCGAKEVRIKGNVRGFDGVRIE